MAHAFGTDLGGVRNVERLRDRCVVDELTGCWLWKGGRSHGRPRVMLVHPETGKHVRMSGPKAAWVLSNGHDVPKGRIAMLTCRSADCCSPEHSKAATRVELGRHLAKTGAAKHDTLRRAQMTRKAREVSGKLSIEIAREIRSSDLPAHEEAKRWGVGKTTITAIRRNERWRETVVVASVFGLGGLAA